MFFPSDQADRLLFLSTTCLPQARQAVARAEDLRREALALVQTSSKALALSAGLLQEKQEMLELYRSDARQLREERDSFFWSPMLWLVVGIAVTAGGTALILSAAGGVK